jgi:hypothetical protein
MAAVLLKEPLAGEVTQPEEERHRRVPPVIGQPVAGLDHRLLDHIRGVDPPLEPAIEP